MTTEGVELHAPPELEEPLSALLPALAQKEVRRVEVFSYSRPGESRYWLSFLFTADGRHSVGTPDIRHLALEEQFPDLLRQLATWVPKFGEP